MNKMIASASPSIMDITRLPEDFGSRRLQNLLIAFDNINRDFPTTQEIKSFPVKLDSFFTITILRGYVRLLVNLREMELHKGQTLVMMPGCLFEGKEMSEDVRFVGLMIDNEFMETMRKNIGIHLDLTQRYYNYVVHDLTTAAMEHYIAMYQLICEELALDDYEHKKDVVQRYCEIWVLKHISLTATNAKSDLSRTLNRREQIFHDFLSLLEKNFTRERSISFYASQMCLTPKYLSTIIKEVSGKHGMQWIDDYVTLEAKALLRNGSLSIKQVSDQLNFPSQSMFGRFFKKMTGYSPKQYKLL